MVAGAEVSNHDNGVAGTGLWCGVGSRLSRKAPKESTPEEHEVGQEVCVHSVQGLPSEPAIFRLPRDIRSQHVALEFIK